MLAEPGEVGLHEQERAGRDHRHRLRSAAGAQGRRSCWPPDEASRCASSRCRATSVFDRQDVAYKKSVLPRGHAAHRRRDGRDATAGGSTAAPPSSASTRYGESAPGAGAVQAFRLHGGERGRHGRSGAASAEVDRPLRFSDHSRSKSTWLSRSASTASAASVAMVLRAGGAELRTTSRSSRINDLLEPDYLAYMLQYDSVHGRFKGDSRGRRQHAHRQRQEDPPDAGDAIRRN